MIITCPECAKRYLVDDTAIEASGRQVQCVACEHNWFFRPTATTKDLDQVHLDMIGIQSSSKRRQGLNLGWILLVMTIVALGCSFILGRSVIQLKLPFTKPIYRSLGLGSGEDHVGLAFESLKSHEIEAQDGKRLVLTGVLSNTGQEVQNIKDLTVTVRGDCQEASWFERFWTVTIKQQSANQCRLKKWHYVPSERKIYPGEKVAFETTANENISGAHSMHINF